jgi:hypothetical protein
MRQVSGLYIGLETAHYLILAHNVIQLKRPVLLDPDLLFDIDPSFKRFQAVLKKILVHIHSGA